MIVLLAAIAALFVLIYFVSQKRRHDDAWRSFRQRYRERRRPSDEPLNPDFQFNQPSDAIQKDRPDEP